MKVKIFFSICLIMGIAMTQLSAQSQQGLDNRTYVTTLPWPDYWQPVYCNGVEVDYLYGSVTSKTEWKRKNGNLIGKIVHVYGEVTSGNSGEIFRVQEHDHFYFTQGIANWNFNLKGNEGTHYIGSMTWDFFNDPNGQNIIVHKAICPGN